MKILLTSDLQWDDQQKNDYRHAFVAQLIALVKKHKPDWLYILGDLTEEKDNHSGWLVNKIVSHVLELSKLTRVLIMRGNHDYKDIQYPFFEFMRHYEDVRWIQNPTVFRGKLFLPHTRDHKAAWTKELLTSSKLIFAHNIFEGVHTGSGHKLNGIPLSVFPKGAKVYSGDVHEPQENGPVTYVGSPYLCDFGDDYDPRVILLDGDRGREESIEVTGPQKRLVEIKAGDVIEEWTANEGDILKVRIQLEPKHQAQFGKIKADIVAAGTKHGFIIDSVQPIVNFQKGKADGGYQKKSPVAYIEEYAASRGIDKLTLKVGKQLEGEE